MMNARKRRELIDEMAHEYTMPLVKALMSTISEETGKSCTQAADIIITAWQRSKDQHIEDECLEDVTAAAR